MSGIFRREILQAHVGHMHGSIMLVRPMSSWILVLGGVLIAAVIVGYLLFGTYTKRTTATGLLLPANGVIRILPPASGVISERRVEEGQQVKKGDVLFVLTDERHLVDDRDNYRLSDLRATSLAQRRESLLRVRNATRLLGRQTQQGLKNRLSSLREELARNEQEIALQTRRIEASARMLERHRMLVQDRFISELALQEKEDQVAALRAQLLAMQRLNTELARNILVTEDELRQAPIRTDTQSAELDREIAALSQEVTEIQTRDRYAITAPMDGMVTAITGQIGQSVGDQAIATIIPANAKLVAHLFPPSRAVGFVEKGQKVRLRYQAYPYQKFGQYAGTVAEISRSPIQLSELPSALPITNQEGVYRITVKLETQSISAHLKTIPLLPGMVLEADIEQDSRRLIEWVLEPVYGLRKYFS